jgi:hypothetical protein
MYEASTQMINLTSPEKIRAVKGAIHIVHRMYPIFFENKDTMFRIMWLEHPQFPGQINSLFLMEAISCLLFKPGFTIKEVDSNAELSLFGKQF